MRGKRPAPERGADEPRRVKPQRARARAEAPARKRRSAPEQRPQRSAPKNSPVRRPVDAPARPKNASQAKARAKARKAKAPKVVRPPLRERLITRLASIEFHPRELVSRVPFVVLVIGALGLGLGVTLWLSTDAAERSYQLGHARQLNQALAQQKEALERDVLEAQAAPALAEAARELGMIPSRDTAHLVQDPTGAWVVVGTPKPAEGVPPPPLNTPLPEVVPESSATGRTERPSAPTSTAPAPQVVDPREVVVRVPPRETPAPSAATPLTAPVAPAAPVAAPPAVDPQPADGLPHLAAPELPAQPGPVGGMENIGPAPQPAPAPAPVEVPEGPVEVPGVPAA